MSREFILSNRIIGCFVVYMQRRVLRIKWSLCTVHRKLLLHRGHVQAGMCCQRCIHCAKHELHGLLLRQGLPGRCQCSLLAVCIKHVVLDWRAKHVPSEDLVTAFVQLHVQLHLRAWIHWPRWTRMRRMRSWNIQAAKRQPGLHCVSHWFLLPFRINSEHHMHDYVCAQHI